METLRNEGTEFGSHAVSQGQKATLTFLHHKPPVSQRCVTSQPTLRDRQRQMAATKRTMVSGDPRQLGFLPSTQVISAVLSTLEITDIDHSSVSFRTHHSQRRQPTAYFMGKNTKRRQHDSTKDTPFHIKCDMNSGLRLPWLPHPQAGHRSAVLSMRAPFGLKLTLVKRHNGVTY